MKPLNKNILITKVVKENTYQNIFLTNEHASLYEVVEVGKEVVEVTPGDQVVLNESKLIKVSIKMKEYYLIEEKDIYMVVEE